MIGTCCSRAKQPQTQWLKASIAHGSVGREFGQDSMWEAVPSSVWAAQLELRVQDGTPHPGLVPSRWLLVAALCLLHVAFSLLMVSILQDLSLCSRTACPLHSDGDPPLGKWRLPATSSPEVRFHHILSVCQNTAHGQSRLRGREISPTSQQEVVVAIFGNYPSWGDT